MNTFAVLLKKEFRQNFIIYFIPLLIWLGLYFTKFQQMSILTPTWQNILAVAIPIALAISYGLQAFDLEENGQTRDFLLTRPLAVSDIIHTKYFTGLAVLLVISFLWPVAILPSSIQWPHFDDFSSFYFSSYLLLLVVLYSSSFITGVFVKGPLKLLVSIISCSVVVGWFFYIWYEIITLCYLQLFGDTPQFIIYLLLIFLTGLLVYISCSFLVTVSKWGLRNPESNTYRNTLRNSALIFLLLPVSAGLINLVNPPVIRPFNSLISTLFGTERWFIAVEGRKQPHGNLYLLNSVDGHLGIAHAGEKPSVIYTPKSSESLVTQVSWSPDGKKVAFKEGPLFRIGSLQGRKLKLHYSIKNGDTLEWSSDSADVLLGKNIQKQVDKTSNKTIYTIQFNHFHLGEQKLVDAKTINSMGLAHAWDSRSNRPIIIDPNWQLILFSLNENKVETIPLMSTGNKNIPPIPFGLIIPPASGGSLYKLVMMTNIINHRYDLVLYNFDSLNNTLKFEKILSKVKYRDLIFDPNQQSLIARIGIGTYFKVRPNQK